MRTRRARSAARAGEPSGRRSHCSSSALGLAPWIHLLVSTRLLERRSMTSTVSM